MERAGAEPVPSNLLSLISPQKHCFSTQLSNQEIGSLFQVLREESSEGLLCPLSNPPTPQDLPPEGLTECGFLSLLRLFLRRDRPESSWLLLRAMKWGCIAISMQLRRAPDMAAAFSREPAFAPHRVLPRGRPYPQHRIPAGVSPPVRPSIRQRRRRRAFPRGSLCALRTPGPPSAPLGDALPHPHHPLALPPVFGSVEHVVAPAAASDRFGAVAAGRQSRPAGTDAKWRGVSSVCVVQRGWREGCGEVVVGAATGGGGSPRGGVRERGVDGGVTVRGGWSWREM